jgi:hypothetical protein
MDKWPKAGNVKKQEITDRQHRMMFRQVRNVQNWGRMIRYNVVLGSRKSRTENMTIISSSALRAVVIRNVQNRGV